MDVIDMKVIEKDRRERMRIIPAWPKAGSRISGFIILLFLILKISFYFVLADLSQPGFIFWPESRHSKKTRSGDYAHVDHSTTCSFQSLARRSRPSLSAPQSASSRPCSLLSPWHHCQNGTRAYRVHRKKVSVNAVPCLPEIPGTSRSLHCFGRPKALFHTHSLAESPEV